MGEPQSFALSAEIRLVSGLSIAGLTQDSDNVQRRALKNSRHDRMARRRKPKPAGCIQGKQTPFFSRDCIARLVSSQLHETLMGTGVFAKHGKAWGWKSLGSGLVSCMRKLKSRVQLREQAEMAHIDAVL
jgi:hypothetical protein